MESIEVIRAGTLPSIEQLKPFFSTITHNWAHQPISPPAQFLFCLTETRFHFFARRSCPAQAHPESRLGRFTPELWKFDVAEFFLRAPDSDRYLEFNLAPNGAWWSCLFEKARQPISRDNLPIPDVTVFGESDRSGWHAQASLPLSWLREHLTFGSESRLNATFILDSPKQIFLSAGDLPSAEPDFHQPDDFPSVKLRSDVTL